MPKSPVKNLSKYRMKKVFKDKIFDIDHILTFRKPVERDNKYKKMNPKGIKLHIAKTRPEIAPMIKTFPKRADFFREYIEKDIIAFFATKDNSVVGYIFATEDDFYDRHLWKNTVHVKPGEFFHFAGYVSPGSRGSIVSLFILQGMYDYFENKGLSAAITTISSRNEPSWRLCRKFGYDQIEKAWDVYKLLGFRWSREVPTRTWVG